MKAVNVTYHISNWRLHWIDVGLVGSKKNINQCRPHEKEEKLGPLGLKYVNIALTLSFSRLSFATTVKWHKAAMPEMSLFIARSKTLIRKFLFSTTSSRKTSFVQATARCDKVKGWECLLKSLATNCRKFGVFMGTLFYSCLTRWNTCFTCAALSFMLRNLRMTGEMTNKTPITGRISKWTLQESV